MSMIKLNVNEVMHVNTNIGRNIVKLSASKNSLSSLSQTIDAQVLARRNIGARINTVYKSLTEVEMDLRSLVQFINESMDRYSSADNHLSARALTLLSSFNKNAQNVEMKGTQKSSPTKNSERWDRKVAGILANSEIGAARDLLIELPKGALPVYYKIPGFRIDGKYMKILNSENYKGGEGLARRYTLDNLTAGKYPNALKLYNLNRAVSKLALVSKSLPWMTGAAAAYQELTMPKSISTERKISNAVITGGTTVGLAIGAAEAGAVIGGAVGSVIPVGGTIVGAVVGAAVGVGIAYGVDKLLNWNFIGTGKDKKSVMSLVKDFSGDQVEKAAKSVGDCVRGASKWIGGLFHTEKPATGG
ncbi:hypothetical protein [Neobacillus vireti]|nr:hypothetical protein [Neobacillus vireti]